MQYDEKIGSMAVMKSGLGLPLFDLALLNCALMAQCDDFTIEKGEYSGFELMENAASAVVDVILRDFNDVTVIHVLCGPGNNGGDGCCVAKLLCDRGLNVRVYALGTPKAGTDAAKAAALWQQAVEPLDAFLPTHEDELMVDALFGAGFRGRLPDDVIGVLRRASACLMRKLAIDVPSGLSGDTGIADYGIDYDATVTFFRKKPGHVSGQGPSRCGKIVVADIGVVADFLGDHQPEAFENGPALWADALCVREHDAHKYAQGHVAVFSGPKYQTGAARLAAIGAARVGAGAVTLLGAADALDVHAAHVSSIMLKQCEAGAPADTLNELQKVRSVVLGPGFGDFAEVRTIAKSCLARTDVRMPTPLVLDADGISAFSDNPEELFALSRARENPALVLTPHQGEFGRLFPDLAADGTLGKLQKAQIAAERAHAVIVYKGADTIIACPKGPNMMDACAAINTNGTPALATAGSGDVLAGIIAGLVAQGTLPFYAACAGVWLHAQAGRAAGPICIAEDILDALPAVLREQTVFGTT